MSGEQVWHADFIPVHLKKCLLSLGLCAGHASSFTPTLLNHAGLCLLVSLKENCIAAAYKDIEKLHLHLQSCPNLGTNHPLV